MKVLLVDLNKDYTDALEEAVSVLGRGGVIIYPTDTLYGIGSNALDKKAVSRVFDIKERPLSKPLPMAVRNLKWAKGLAYIGRKQEVILNKVWPGRVTAIVAKRESVPDILTSGRKTAGMRVPDYPLINRMLKLFGYPITSTSANMSGQEPTNDINEIIKIFSGRLARQPDLVLDAGILPKSEPSAIVDLTGDKPKISRIGPSRPDEFMKLLNI